jgi:hypothetical protein
MISMTMICRKALHALGGDAVANDNGEKISAKMPRTLPMAAPIRRFRLMTRSLHSNTMMATPISRPTAAAKLEGRSKRTNEEADDTDNENKQKAYK